VERSLAEAYLFALGVETGPGRVDAATLRRLQRAHLARFPYETLDIVRGSPPGIDPVASVRRLLAGRGGYCYHLNGAFSELLRWLEVAVTRHRAGVQGRGVTVAPGADGNHLALTARIEPGEWLVDVGLGDGPADPLPLVAGTHEVEGCRYTLAPSATDPGGWRFEHDPTGGFVGFDVAPGAVELPSFDTVHRLLSTESGFARVVTVQRRVGARLEVLRGCVFAEHEETGSRERDVTDADAWWSLVLDHFGLAYGGLSRAERAVLWRQVRAAHETWDAAGRP
jgi:arylamine N-acetyltransferase